jgi:ribonuclease D
MDPVMVPEENPALQERTRQAALYFSNNLKSGLVSFLEKARFETDNKAVGKLLAEALEKLQKEVFIKWSCLESCRHGFETISYIKTRSNAEVDFRPSARQINQAAVQYPDKTVHPELYAALKKWRDTLADEHDIPRYMVLPQKSIVELMHKLPTTLAGLKTIKGIGQAKLNQYGSEILDIISGYCNDHEIVPEQIEIPVIEKKVKVNSGKLSYEMFKSGKTMMEIAKERNLSLSTIESHLALHVGNGDLDISRFVSSEKLKKVVHFIRGNPEKTLGEIKSAMGDSVSYADLKFILQHLRVNNL